MKRKTLTLAISVFALLAIISVGFASWVITRTDDDVNLEGSISVDTVEDKDLGLSAKWVRSLTDQTEVTNPVIKFGAMDPNDPKYSLKTKNWLLNESTEKENLSVFLMIQVENKDALNGKKISVNLNPVVPPANTTFAEAANKKELFQLPTIIEDMFTADKFGSNNYVIVELNFKWGTLFNSVNPSSSDASWAGEYDATKATQVRNLLQQLETALKDVSYNVVVSAVSTK